MALRCALLGDVAGLRASYEQVAHAIRARDLPAAELATRVRLSKTPEAYFATRNSHKETAYEALIAAGHLQWQPG
ncbi:hypothetical protein SE17_25420, partial [Kouleothrix aurantiaca]